MSVIRADKYGIEPVYYTTHDGKFLSGRTIKELVLRPKIDLYALREYFTFQNIVSDRTLFKGVKVVPPGCEVNPDGTLHRYFYFETGFPTRKDKYKDCVEHLRILLNVAVWHSMFQTSQTPVGGLLSGGLDSSVIATFAQEDYLYPTFTVGFMDYRKFDESELATLVAKHLNLVNHQLLLGPSALPDTIDKVTEALEELRISITYPDYAAYQLASMSVKTLLTGTGGDELFAGYPWKYKASDSEYLAMVQRLVPERDHSEFFSDYVMRETQGYSPLEEFHRRYRYDTIYDRFYIDLKFGLFGQLITNDKLARRHGLQVKYPFLDDELVQFALRLPAEYKYKNGVGKRILRDAMKGLLPRNIIKRPKQGFYPPDEHWYRNENAEFVGKKFDSLKKTDFFKPYYLDKIYVEHMSGVNHTRLLWSLMSFESWLRINRINRINEQWTATRS